MLFSKKRFIETYLNQSIYVTVETGGPEDPVTGELPRQSRVRAESLSPTYLGYAQ